MKTTQAMTKLIVALSTIHFVNGFAITTKTTHAKHVLKNISSFSSISKIRPQQPQHSPFFGIYRNANAAANASNARLFQTRLFASVSDKARVLFLGTPDVAADSLKRIVEESQKEDW